MAQTYSTQSFSVAPDFIVIVSNEDDYHASFHDFAEKVNRKLRAGYQLHGQPFNINKTVCQAMLRPEGAAPNGDTAAYYKRPEDLHLA
jgi:hypothetical protein